MVGHIPLEDGIGVRVPVPQLEKRSFFRQGKVRELLHVRKESNRGREVLYLVIKIDFMTESL